MRVRKPRVKLDGGLVVVVGCIDLAQPGLCDPDKVFQLSIRRPSAPRFLKLLQCRLVFLLTKEFKTLVQRTPLCKSGQGEK